jgi:hypothetical protein
LADDGGEEEGDRDHGNGEKQEEDEEGSEGILEEELELEDVATDNQDEAGNQVHDGVGHPPCEPENGILNEKERKQLMICLNDKVFVGKRKEDRPSDP